MTQIYPKRNKNAWILDLLLAASDAVLVRDTSVHARRLQLVVVGQSRVELLLRALQVRLLRRQGALLVRLLRRLVLHVLGVRRAVHGRLAAELVERVLGLSLRRLGVRLETSLQVASRFHLHPVGTSTADSILPEHCRLKTSNNY